MDDKKQMDRVQKIPISELVPFKDHPFKVVEDESMLRTTESISMFGVLTPLIARPIEDGKYEIISGHRRAHAAEAVGMTEVPVPCCGQQPAKGEHPPVRKGVCLQDESGCYEASGRTFRFVDRRNFVPSWDEVKDGRTNRPAGWREQKSNTTLYTPNKPDPGAPGYA